MSDQLSEGRLFIGTRRYSSWSMRGWLAVRLAGLIVEDVVIPLAGGTTPEVRRRTPAGTVPYLEHRHVCVWESLAIGEYCAEQAWHLWPSVPVARGWARSIAAEMHSGFRELRTAMPMSLFRSARGGGRTPGALADIARIEAMWHDTREMFGGGGPFLFGATFGIADAMFAPIVARFLTYAPELSSRSRAYCEAVRAHPLVDKWYAAAEVEPPQWFIDRFEAPVGSGSDPVGTP